MSNRIVKILMERDDLTEDEARERVDAVKQMLNDCDAFDAEDVIECELGLEPDYIFDLIFDE